MKTHWSLCMYEKKRFKKPFNQQFSVDDFSLPWGAKHVDENNKEDISGWFHSWDDNFSQLMPYITYCCPYAQLRALKNRKA